MQYRFRSKFGLIGPAQYVKRSSFLLCHVSTVFPLVGSVRRKRQLYLFQRKFIFLKKSYINFGDCICLAILRLTMRSSCSVVDYFSSKIRNRDTGLYCIKIEMKLKTESTVMQTTGSVRHKLYLILIPFATPISHVCYNVVQFLNRSICNDCSI